MSGNFGGGFGGDFDDLLPARSSAAPNLSNPFDNPFADIGRTQESDPWASYDKQDTEPDTTTQAHDAFYAPSADKYTNPAEHFGYEPSPPSPIQEPPEGIHNNSFAPDPPSHTILAPTDLATNTYLDPETTTSFTPTDHPASLYHAPAPFSNPSPSTPPPTRTPVPAANPISPSKAGLLDEPSGPTFGSGFVRRHKVKPSAASAVGQSGTESRAGSLFSLASADPLEALVFKARSSSTARSTPPITPKPELAPGAKPLPDEKFADPLDQSANPPTPKNENPPGTPLTSADVAPTLKDAAPPEVQASVISSPPSAEQIHTDGSTPKEPPTLLEPGSQTPPERSVTPTAADTTSVDRPRTPTAQVQSEDASNAPTPPSRAASESQISSYPEGSTFLHPAQDSPGPGAYARIVSPLDTPVASNRNLSQSFSGLALGGEVPNLQWTGQAPSSNPPTTPAARGWGSVDSADGWGGETTQTGWGESEGTFVGQSATPGQSDETESSTPEHSRKPSESNDSDVDRNDTEDSRSGTPQQTVSRQAGVPSVGTFVITVGDPQKVGDPINPYIVYTVSTKTTSPHYRKPHFSVLRRYSDFLWLFETLSLNKPGVFIPPIPEKQGFGRFQGAFVEARRLALNNCVQKIANHPILSTDEDFKFFIESDSFALDVKHRKAELAQEKTGGFLSSITGPKFYETDEWFDAKRSYIDALESQLRGLAKAAEMVAKHRTEVATATAEFAEAIVVLSVSDLSKQLSQSLAILADVNKRARKLEDDQAQDDLVLLVGIVEEYIRLIGSIRLTFTSRIRLHATWQNANAEAKRVRLAHEKARRQGRIPQDRVGLSMHEMAEAEKRAADAKNEFDQCSRLIKAEMARFEKERIDDFKRSFEELLEGMIRRQQEVIESLESYQEGLLRRSKSILGQSSAPAETQTTSAEE